VPLQRSSDERGPLGGYLTRARNGDLYTMQTQLVGSWTIMGAQELWSNVRQRRYAKDLDNLDPRADMKVIWWRGPCWITCGNCRRQIVRVMSYKAGREYGFVLDTTKKQADPAHQRPKPGMKFWFDGYIGGRPGRTSFNVSCPQCHQKDLRRNVRREAKKIFDERLGQFLVNDRSLRPTA
jgi:hypothetical protein